MIMNKTIMILIWSSPEI